MAFSKSIAFDDENTANASAVAGVTPAFTRAEIEFIDRLRAGNAEAFDELIDRFSGDIYSLLHRITEDPEEAGELTQETFLSALRSIRNFRGESEIKTWLYRIAMNHSRNRFRWWSRRGRGVTVSLDSEIGGSEVLLRETLDSGSATPEDLTLRREREIGLRLALHGLPDAYREAVILCDIEGLSYEEIAATLELNIGTVKSRIARGRDELRRRLKDI
jgi:RNA polymerase sigma-70 factor (ECF subfamily)